MEALSVGIWEEEDFDSAHSLFCADMAPSWLPFTVPADCRAVRLLLEEEFGVEMELSRSCSVLTLAVLSFLVPYQLCPLSFTLFPSAAGRSRDLLLSEARASALCSRVRDVTAWCLGAGRDPRKVGCFLLFGQFRRDVCAWHVTDGYSS